MASSDEDEQNGGFIDMQEITGVVNECDDDFANDFTSPSSIREREGIDGGSEKRESPKQIKMKDYLINAFRDMLGEGGSSDKEEPSKDECGDDDDDAVDFTEPDPFARELSGRSGDSGKDVPLERNPEYLRGLIRKLNATNGENGEDSEKGVSDIMFWSYAYGVLCDYVVIAKGEDDPKWDLIRERLAELRAEGKKALRDAVEADQGDYHTTPLHLACRRKPPADVISSLIDASPRMLNWGDRNGLHSSWLPVHCACEYRASTDVVELLISRFPDATTARTYLGNTPLHLACSIRRFNDDIPSPKLMSLLATEDALKVVNEEGLTAVDVFMRTVAFFRAKSDLERQSCVDCMKILVKGTPLGRGKYIQSFHLAPAWLRDDTLALPEMQHFLNDKMKMRLSTGILMADVYAQIIMIVSFTVVANNTMPARSDSVDVTHHISEWLVLLFLSNTYRILRELFHFFVVGIPWLGDPWNWLDGANITLVLASAVLMATRLGDDDRVRILVMVTGGLVWVMGLVFLKSTYRPFAVFISGVFNMIAALIPFLVSTGLVLGAFAYMYYINTESTETCADDYWREGSSFCTYKGSWLQVYTFFIGGLSDFHFTNGGVQDKPGEIEEYYNPGNLALSVIYGFLIAIFLRSILIAIANDAWSNTTGRGEIVFWEARFNFIAEVHLIRLSFVHLCGALCGSSGSSSSDKRTSGSFICCKDKSDPDPEEEKTDQWAVFWDIVALTYANHRDASVVWEEVDKFEKSNISFLLCGYRDYRDWKKIEVSLWFRRVLFLAFGLLWILAGVATFGWLWPEKVREFLFCPAVSLSGPKRVEDKKVGEEWSDNAEGSHQEADTMMRKIVREEVKALKEEIMSEIAKMKAELSSEGSKTE